MKSLVYILVVVLAACGSVTQRVKVDDAAIAVEEKKQSEIALRSIVDDFVRLRSVAYPLATKANALCGKDVTYTTGLLFANANLYKDLKDAAGTVYGWTDAVKVMRVIPGSAAEASGIKAGDIVLTINEWKVPVGDGAVNKLYRKLAKMTDEGKPVVLNVLRGEEKKQLTVSPEKACASEVLMAQDDIVNAFADGSHVVIFRGMLRFTKDDTELALVVSHEMSHNAMGHIGKQRVNSIWGIALDLLIAASTGVNTQGLFQKLALQVHSKDFEAEADYVGLYMMANAGMDIEHAPEFWRRMAEAHPGSIHTNMMATHPATPYRMLALEKAVKEIAEKRASNAPLVPEKKDKKPDSVQSKVEQTAPTQSANSMAPTSQDSGVTAREQLGQDKSRASKNEDTAPSGSPNVQPENSFQDGLNAYGQKDYTKALSIFRGLADQGNARAQTNLGIMYERGVGVAKDDGEAVKWYRKAADQGFVTAQFNLGYMYSNGRGVAKDNAEAVKWYRKAADQGLATAQFNLGLKYQRGEGVAKDHGEADKWLHKAADQGYIPAQETLKLLAAQ